MTDMEQITTSSENRIISDIRALIEQSRLQVAAAVNTGMTLMYWHIGERINREVLGGERAAYGKQIVATISQRLTAEYGGSQFSVKNLNRMRLFAERFPDLSIWTPLVSKLSWSQEEIEQFNEQFHRGAEQDGRWRSNVIPTCRFTVNTERTKHSAMTSPTSSERLSRMRTSSASNRSISITNHR